MAKTVHVIDPNPDTIVILKNPLVDFAVWNPSDAAKGDEIKEQAQQPVAAHDDGWPTEFSRRKFKKKKQNSEAIIPERGLLNGELIHDEHQVMEEDSLTPGGEFTYSKLGKKARKAGDKEPRPTINQGKATFAAEKTELLIETTASSSRDVRTSIFGNGSMENGCEESQAAESSYALDLQTSQGVSIDTTSCNGMSNLKVSDNPANEDGVHYHVSSRHLILASKRFRTMMTGEKWKEGLRDEDGLFYTRPDGWDAKTFLVLMNIFHLQHRQVPRTISLETLAKVAVLVDFYECEEAVEVFTKMWIEDLRKKSPVPSTYCRELILWLCIARVFDLVDEFKQTTLIALKQTKEGIRTMELPIWPTITSEIDFKRYQAIEDIVSQLFGLLDKYRSSEYKCPKNNEYSFLCGSFHLGSLTKEMDAIGLLSPRPEVPFEGVSFEDICENLRRVQLRTWTVSDRYNSYQHPCNLRTAVNELVVNVAQKVEGLNLKDFRKEK